MIISNNRIKNVAPSLMLLCWSATLAACVGVNSSPDLSHLQASSEIERHALTIVEKRTEAYNAHDLEAFLATYHPNVRVYEYPEKFLGEGRERMGAIFGSQFKAGEGIIHVHSRHALENTVVSDETVRIFDSIEHNIGIYTIEDGLIVEVRLIEPGFSHSDE